MNDYTGGYAGCSGGSCGSSYGLTGTTPMGASGVSPTSMDMASSMPGYASGYPQTMTGTQTVPGTQIPSGIQMVPSTQPPTGGIPAADLAPITALNQPMPITTQSLQYINGFLRTQIGKKVTVDFLIGTNTLVDRTGTLLGVGANYILINEVETDDLLVCDFYSIKFVRVYY